MKKGVCLIFFLSYLYASNAQNPSWTTEIAPSIYENCSSCHHAGAIAPFELMSYEDVVERHIMFVIGIANNRDVIPFPRTPGNVGF